MNKLRLTLNTLAVVILTLTVTSLAQAQATRTWVSGVGDDVNPCSRTAPCKTFAGAISKTAANGEISVLDPGGFGAITITKSITIDGAGTLASILASGTSGVIVNDALAAVPASSNVILRNLSINGAGTTFGTNGVRFLRGRTLTLKNVEISNFSTTGIDANIQTAVTPTVFTRMFLVDVDINNITGVAAPAISISAPNAFFSVAMDRVHTQRVHTGVKSGSHSFLTIRNSMFTNGTVGLETISGSAGAPVAYLENTDLSENTTGLVAGSGTTAVLSQVSITVCSTGISGGGAVRSSGNNRILANSNDGVVPAITNPK
jgi:hypothetical protein